MTGIGYECCRLRIKQIDVLVICSWYFRTVVCWQSPPGFLQRTHQSVDDIWHETLTSLHQFGHYEGCQLAAFLEHQSFVMRAITHLFIFRKDADRQTAPILRQILFTKGDVALTHGLWDGVTPKRVTPLR